MDAQEIVKQKMDPPFSSEAFAQFILDQCIDQTTSLPHYPRSNGFIERQIETIKTALSTSQATGQTIRYLLLNIRSQPIGPHMPSAREILHNHTGETWKTLTPC